MEILPNVYLGNKKVANNADFLKSNNIGYVLNCTTNIKNYFENVKKVQQIRKHRHVEFGYQPKPQINFRYQEDIPIKSEENRSSKDNKKKIQPDDGLIFDEESSQEGPISEGTAMEVVPTEKSLTSYENAEVLGESDIPAHKMEDEENELMDLTNEGWEVGTEDSVMMEDEDSVQNIVIENIQENGSKKTVVERLEEQIKENEANGTSMIKEEEDKPSKFGKLVERAQLHQDGPVALDDIMQQIKPGVNGAQSNKELDSKNRQQQLKEEMNKVDEEATQHIKQIAENVKKIISQRAKPLPELPESQTKPLITSTPLEKPTHTKVHPQLKSLPNPHEHAQPIKKSEMDPDISYLKQQTELDFNTSILPEGISKIPLKKSININTTLNCHRSKIEVEEETKYITVEFDTPVQYLRVPVHDSMEQDLSKYWHSAAEFIKHAVNQNSAILVHCREGKSRSVSMIIAYALIEGKMTLQEIFNKISNLAPIRPNDGFKIQLMDLERDIRNESSINFFENRSAKFKRSFSEMMASAYGEFDDDLDFNDEDAEDWGWTPQRSKRMGRRNPISFKLFQAHFKDHRRQLRLTDMLKIKKKKNPVVDAPKKMVEPVKPPPKKKKRVQMTLSAFVKKK